jgi:hypothetical protein
MTLCGRMPRHDDPVGLYNTFPHFEDPASNVVENVADGRKLFNYTPDGTKVPKVCCHCRANFYSKIHRHVEIHGTDTHGVGELEDVAIEQFFFALLNISHPEQEEELPAGPGEKKEEDDFLGRKMFTMQVSLNVIGPADLYLELRDMNDIIRKIYDDELWADALISRVSLLEEGEELPIGGEFAERMRVRNE